MLRQTDAFSVEVETQHHMGQELRIEAVWTIMVKQRS